MLRNWIMLIENASQDWDFNIRTLRGMIAVKDAFVAEPGCDTDDDGISWAVQDKIDDASSEEEMLSAYFDYLVDRFSEIMRRNNGSIPVFRVITVKEIERFIDSVHAGKPLGLHWSFEQDSASADYHGGPNHQHEIILCAHVKEHDVCWASTFQQNFGHQHEQEVVVVGPVFDMAVYDTSRADGTHVFQGHGPFKT